MPVIPENAGIRALAAIIKYAVEIKIWNEEMEDDGNAN
jgi:hypothetical protein